MEDRLLYGTFMFTDSGNRRIAEYTRVVEK